jgi:glycosyltransferase involved in cell wall biosynthesis
MTPLFSICIVVRDRPVLLLLAIRSALACDFDSFDVVVVDDGSARPVTEVLAEAGLDNHHQIRVVRQPPLGIAAARNTAIAAAEGDFVTVLDSDDELAPDALRLLEAHIKQTDADWVYGDYEEVSHRARRVIRLPSYGTVSRMRLAVLTRPRVPFKHSGMTIRRQTLSALGGYDETMPLKVDVELMLRALSQGILPGHLEQPIVRFRRHHGNISRHRLLGLRAWLVLIDRYCPRLIGMRTGVKALRASSELGKWLAGIGT